MYTNTYICLYMYDSNNLYSQKRNITDNEYDKFLN